MSLTEHIPTQAEIIARRVRMGFAPASNSPVFSPHEPAKEPAMKAVAPVAKPIPRSPMLPSLLGDPPTLAEIKRLVSFVHGIPLSEILSAGRHPALVKARDHIVWLACRHTFKSTPQIGEAIGGRDHTTVLHSLFKTIGARNKACRGNTPESVLTRARNRKGYMRAIERKRVRLNCRKAQLQ